MSDEQRQKLEQLIVDNNLLMTALVKDLVEDAYARTITDIENFGVSKPSIEQYFVGYSACLFDCIKYLNPELVDSDNSEFSKFLSNVILQFHTLSLIMEQAEKQFGLPLDDDLFNTDYLELDQDYDPLSE
jgi:hypothetical protein